MQLDRVNALPAAPSQRQVIAYWSNSCRGFDQDLSKPKREPQQSVEWSDSLRLWRLQLERDLVVYSSGVQASSLVPESSSASWKGITVVGGYRATHRRWRRRWEGFYRALAIDNCEEVHRAVRSGCLRWDYEEKLEIKVWESLQRHVHHRNQEMSG